MEEDLKQHIENWKAIAVYLADCHAATAGYDGELKSTSNSRRERFAAICNTAEMSLRCGCLVGVPKSDIDRVIMRCKKNAERMKEISTHKLQGM